MNPKIPGRGKRYCPECDEFARASAIEKRRIVQRSASEERRRSAGRPHTRNKNAPPGTKWCNRCTKWMKLSQFSPNKSKGSGLSSYCRSCQKSAGHEARMRRTYGITYDQYYAILDKQDGKCAICLKTPRTKMLAVDHNHKTGLVRGLLCTTCNSGILAGAQDSRDTLMRAVEYLDNPPARGIADDPVPES